MRIFLILILFIQLINFDYLAQNSDKSDKVVSIGLVPYELLGRKSSALLLFEGEKISYGYGVSYIYRTEFDGSYLFPYMKDRFFYKGFQGDFLIGKSDLELETHYFVSGLHFLYYDHAAVTNGKVGDEVGWKSYNDGRKYGVHLGYSYMRNLNENIRFFFKPSFYFSKYQRIYTGYHYLKYYSTPKYQDSPQFQSDFIGEISFSVGLFFGVKLRK